MVVTGSHQPLETKNLFCRNNSEQHYKLKCLRYFNFIVSLTDCWQFVDSVSSVSIHLLEVITMSQRPMLLGLNTFSYKNWWSKWAVTKIQWFREIFSMYHWQERGGEKSRNDVPAFAWHKMVSQQKRKQRKPIACGKRQTISNWNNLLSEMVRNC